VLVGGGIWRDGEAIELAPWWAVGINERGQVLCTGRLESSPPDGPFYDEPGIWDNGSVRRLGVPEGYMGAEPRLIADDGDVFVAGQSGLDCESGYPFCGHQLWNDGSYHRIDFAPSPLGPCGRRRARRRERSAGTIAGIAVVWQAGVLTEIAEPQWTISSAYWVANGRVAGRYTEEADGSSSSGTFIWHEGRMANVVPGLLATHLSADGTSLLGRIGIEYGWQAVVWRDGSTAFLPALYEDQDCESLWINRRDQVVGRCAVVKYGPYTAVLWEKETPDPD
jgi:hypothetical protein